VALMATLLGEDYVDEPLDWRLMDDAEPLSAALQPSQPPPEPRKALDVSKGAPSALTQPEPRQDSGGIGALKEAMAQARQNRMGAELGMAGETIANAFVPQKSSGFWQRQLEGADRPVQELQAQQKMRGEVEKLRGEGLDRDLKRQQVDINQMSAQALVDAKTAALEKAKREADLEKRKGDLTSPETQAAQAALSSTKWGEALGPEAIKGLTARDIELGALTRKSLRGEDDTLARDKMALMEKLFLLGETGKDKRAAIMANTKDATTTTKADAKSAEDEAEARMVDRERLPDAPKLSDTERSKYRQKIISNTDFDRLIEKAQTLLKDNTRAELLNPWSQARAEWKSLYGKMLGAYKNDEGLGALDGGVQTLVDKVMGGDKELAAGNAGALLNQAKGETRAKMDTWDHVYGYRLKTQPGQLPPNKPPPKAPAKTPGAAQPPVATTPPPAGAPAPPAPAGGSVLMRFPDGSVRPVAPDKMQKARDMKAVEAANG